MLGLKRASTKVTWLFDCPCTCVSMHLLSHNIESAVSRPHSEPAEEEKARPVQLFLERSLPAYPVLQE